MIAGLILGHQRMVPRFLVEVNRPQPLEVMPALTAPLQCEPEVIRVEQLRPLCCPLSRKFSALPSFPLRRICLDDAEIEKRRIHNEHLCLRNDL